MWRVKRTRVVGGIGTEALIEDVVDQVVRCVGDHEADRSQQEKAEIEAWRPNGEQARDRGGRERHRLDASAGEDQPPRDEVVRAGRRAARGYGSPPGPPER